MNCLIIFSFILCLISSCCGILVLPYKNIPSKIAAGDKISIPIFNDSFVISKCAALGNSFLYTGDHKRTEFPPIAFYKDSTTLELYVPEVTDTSKEYFIIVELPIAKAIIKTAHFKITPGKKIDLPSLDGCGKNVKFTNNDNNVDALSVSKNVNNKFVENSNRVNNNNEDIGNKNDNDIKMNNNQNAGHIIINSSEINNSKLKDGTLDNVTIIICAGVCIVSLLAIGSLLFIKGYSVTNRHSANYDYIDNSTKSINQLYSNIFKPNNGLDRNYQLRSYNNNAPLRGNYPIAQTNYSVSQVSSGNYMNKTTNAHVPDENVPLPDLPITKGVVETIVINPEKVSSEVIKPEESILSTSDRSIHVPGENGNISLLDLPLTFGESISLPYLPTIKEEDKLLPELPIIENESELLPGLPIAEYENKSLPDIPIITEGENKSLPDLPITEGENKALPDIPVTKRVVENTVITPEKVLSETVKPTESILNCSTFVKLPVSKIEDTSFSVTKGVVENIEITPEKVLSETVKPTESIINCSTFDKLPIIKIEDTSLSVTKGVVENVEITPEKVLSETVKPTESIINCSTFDKLPIIKIEDTSLSVTKGVVENVEITPEKVLSETVKPTESIINCSTFDKLPIIKIEDTSLSVTKGVVENVEITPEKVLSETVKPTESIINCSTFDKLPIIKIEDTSLSVTKGVVENVEINPEKVLSETVKPTESILNCSTFDKLPVIKIEDTSLSVTKGVVENIEINPEKVLSETVKPTESIINCSTFDKLPVIKIEDTSLSVTKGIVENIEINPEKVLSETVKPTESIINCSTFDKLPVSKIEDTSFSVTKGVVENIEITPDKVLSETVKPTESIINCSTFDKLPIIKIEDTSLSVTKGVVENVEINPEKVLSETVKPTESILNCSTFDKLPVIKIEDTSLAITKGVVENIMINPEIVISETVKSDESVFNMSTFDISIEKSDNSKLENGVSESIHVPNENENIKLPDIKIEDTSFSVTKGIVENIEINPEKILSETIKPTESILNCNTIDKLPVIKIEDTSLSVTKGVVEKIEINPEKVLSETIKPDESVFNMSTINMSIKKSDNSIPDKSLSESIHGSDKSENIPVIKIEDTSLAITKGVVENIMINPEKVLSETVKPDESIFNMSTFDMSIKNSDNYIPEKGLSESVNLSKSIHVSDESENVSLSNFPITKRVVENIVITPEKVLSETVEPDESLLNMKTFDSLFDMNTFDVSTTSSGSDESTIDMDNLSMSTSDNSILSFDTLKKNESTDDKFKSTFKPLSLDFGAFDDNSYHISDLITKDNTPSTTGVQNTAEEDFSRILLSTIEPFGESNGSFIELVQSKQMKVRDSIYKILPTGPTENKPPKLNLEFVAQNDYKAKKVGELNVKTKDILSIVENLEDGSYMVSNTTTGASGKIPAYIVNSLL